MTFFFIVFCLGIILLPQIIINIRNDREWHEGLFEREEVKTGPDHDPLLEAYIHLGALMVRKDISSYNEKILFLNSYFSKHFPQSHYDFGRSFTESLKHPVRPRVISNRLRWKLPHRKQRLQILYFLAGLSTVDGSMNQREMDLLKEMSVLLQLSTKDYDSIIAIYTQKRERIKSSENAKPRPSQVELACTILGVSEQATKDEIKKAYRQLVKLHHPDRFATGTVAHQEMAEKRFIEIQKAYELLEKRWR
jgi:DnaJ like chaperone protein